MPNLSGQSIGRYHILEKLGEGGMATVYKAYDTRLERNVAVKVLRTEMFSPVLLEEVLQRFEREAKSLAKLSHPNIVNILDYGEHEEMPYLIMEFLPGGTLKQQLGQAIPWREAVRMILPVASGLSYAHQNGIIHRDVKPSNILLQATKSAVLTDFGIAKLLEGVEGQTLTGSGVGVGTPEYMAPEQGIGAHEIDARADIYSLGIVLYEMVTGRKPYIADTPMAVVLKQMTDPLPRPTEFVPDLPEKIEHILLKALAKEPDDRYQSMDALVKALEETTREVKTTHEVPADKLQPPPSAPAPDPTKLSESAPETLIAKELSKSLFQRWALPAAIIVGIIAVSLWIGFGRTNGSEQPVSRPPQTTVPSQGEPQEAPPTARPTENTPPLQENPSLPGRVVIPIENMAPEIPWLPMDPNAIPATTWIAFNVNSHPFDNPMVRKAFAAAIDREAVTEISREAFANDSAQPATTLLPPDILGRYLYGEIGTPFDPDSAREYLAVAGYPDGENFPPVMIMVNENEPNHVIFDAVIHMWMDILNIQVDVEYIQWEVYTETIYNNHPPIFRFGWLADINDPENFMQIYRNDSEFNHSGFSNPRYDQLVDRALQTTNPAERQELYIEAERILCEEETVIIPLYHFTSGNE